MTTSEAEQDTREQDTDSATIDRMRTRPDAADEAEQDGAVSPEEEPASTLVSEPAPVASRRSRWAGVLPRWLLPPRGYRLPTLLVVLAVMLVGAGSWFLVAGTTLRTSDAATNRALTDVAGTNEVSAAVTSALHRVFSYSPDNIDGTEEAAAEVLRDEAQQEYEALFPRVRALAPEQDLTLTANVSASAVQYLDDDRAELLVFLDQSATRESEQESDAEPATSGSQLSVTAERADNHWVLTEIDPH